MQIRRFVTRDLFRAQVFVWGVSGLGSKIPGFYGAVHAGSRVDSRYTSARLALFIVSTIANIAQTYPMRFLGTLKRGLLNELTMPTPSTCAFVRWGSLANHTSLKREFKDDEGALDLVMVSPLAEAPLIVI